MEARKELVLHLHLFATCAKKEQYHIVHSHSYTLHTLHTLHQNSSIHRRILVIYRLQRDQGLDFRQIRSYL